MSVLDTLPLLVVVLLLVAGSGADPDAVLVAFDGDQTPDELAGPDASGPLVVAGGQFTVPANASVDGALYVVGGTATVEGTVDGDVTVLAGNLTVADPGVVAGELQSIGGQTDVAAGATVARRTSVDVTPRERTLAERVGVLAMQALALAALAFLLARRYPTALATVGDAATDHALVSGVVGALAGTTLLVGLVAMAFTIVLIPVSVLGVFAEFLVVAYAIVAVGARLGRVFPIERNDVAAATGTAALVVALDLLDAVPVVGALVALAVVCVGLGAVLVTYFGLQRFEPVQLPG
jgi:hypothetical protein